MIIYAVSFLLTLSIESLVIFLLLKEQWKKTLLYLILINCFTWPLATIIYNLGVDFYLLELNVILVESFLIAGLFKKDYFYSLGVSFMANLLTAGMSFLV